MGKNTMALIALLLLVGDGVVALVAALQLALNWKRGRTFIIQSILFLCLSGTVGMMILANAALPQPIRFSLEDMRHAANPDAALVTKMEQAEQVEALWAPSGKQFRLIFLGTLLVLSVGLWPASVDWLVVIYRTRRNENAQTAAEYGND